MGNGQERNFLAVAPGTGRRMVSVRNKNTYANRRGTGGTGYVKSAFVLLTLALLSFALGFFVLARLVPDDHADRKSNNGSAASRNADSGDKIAASAADRKPAPPRKIAASPVIPATPKKDDGPLIEGPDETPTQTPTTPDAVKPAVTPSERPKTNPDATQTMPAAPNSDGAVQTPKQPDSGENPAAPTDAPPTERKRYHVQINLHETREAAEQEAQQIVDKGFKARVRRVMRDGRPLYRVEYGAVYKHKSNADATLAKLRDAGIDTAIITER